MQITSHPARRKRQNYGYYSRLSEFHHQNSDVFTLRFRFGAAKFGN
ncbi:hypothetical protein [Frigidibacter oleivorans]|nr:hypothetical protein [Frigidibacter oleivorans]